MNASQLSARTAIPAPEAARRPALPAGLSRRAWLLIIVGVFTATCVLYSTVIQDWHPYDEPAHFLYVQKILQKGELPGRNENYQAVHPPSYYALCAVAAWPVRHKSFSAQLHYLRLFNILFGICSLLIMYKTALFLAGDRAAIACTALAASVPLLNVIFSSVSNDNLGVLTAWLALYVLCVQARGGFTTRGVALSAAACGLACLAKSVNAYLVPLFILFYLIYRRDKTWSATLKHAAVFLALFLPLGFAWQAYAYTQYGMNVLGNANAEAPQPYAFWLPANAVRWLRLFFITFWMFVDFLRNTVPRRPEAVYYLCFLAVTLGLIGATLRFMLARDPQQRDQRILSWLLLAGFALAIIEILIGNWSILRASGRYSYPALSGLIIVWYWAMARLFGPRAATAAAIAFFLIVNILNIIFAIHYIRGMAPMPFTITPDLLSPIS